MPAAPDPIDCLLAHTEFLRRLARDLAGDPVAGDDLAQQVWLRALERPPEHQGAVRGWLARTAQRLWSNEQRNAFRRRRREQKVAPGEAVPTPEQILVREATRQQVVQAVLDLQAPFREVVLLRYFEGLEPTQIAGRLAVPAATVRSRLHRGLDRLRAHLDAAHGRRAAWAPMVLSLVVPGRRRATAVQGAMTSKAALALTVLALGLGAVIMLSRSYDPIAAPAASERAVVAAASIPAATKLDASTASRTTAPITPRSLQAFPAKRARGRLRVLVHDGNGPRAGVDVVVTPRTGPLPPLQPFVDDRGFRVADTTGPDGWCEFGDLPEGPVHVVARVAGTTTTGHAIVSADARRATRLLMLSDDAEQRWFEVCVIHNHRPVAGVDVRFFGWRDDEDSMISGGSLPTAPLATRTTGDDGIVRLEQSALSVGVAIARTDDGLVGLVPVPFRADQQLALQVGPVAHLRGRVCGVGVERLRGAAIELCALSSTDANMVFAGHGTMVSIEGGSFVAHDLPAGTYGIVLHRAGDLRLANVGVAGAAVDTASMQTVVLQPGTTATLELNVRAGARIAGRVVRDGVPVVGASVRASMQRPGRTMQRYGSDGVPYWGTAADDRAPANPVTTRSTCTDAEGRYVFDGLSHDPYRIDVGAVGCSFDTRWNVQAGSDAATVLEHELRPAGVLQLATRDSMQLVLRHKDELRDTVHVECCGARTLPGLREGSYTLLMRNSLTSGAAPVALGTVEVRAGHTTWLDLEPRQPVFRVAGVVRSGTQPVVGAVVGGGVTDASGEFVLERSSRVGDEAMVLLRQNGTKFLLRTAEAPGGRLDVQLGEQHVDVVCVDAGGEPAMARVTLSGDPGGGAIRRVGIAGRTAADGVLRVGPIPLLPLRGTVVFDDGYLVELVVDAGQDRVEVRRPTTVMMTVRVEREGRPVVGSVVGAVRWSGDDPAPESDEQYLAGAAGQIARTDATGAATLAVEPGEQLIVTGLERWTRRSFRRVLVGPAGPDEVKIEALSPQ